MAASINEDSVRIQIKNENGEQTATLQTTVGGSAANTAQATTFLQAQLKALSNRSVSLCGRQITHREIIFIFVAFILGVTAFGLMITVILSDQALSYEKKMVTCTDYDCYTSASAVQRKVDKTNAPCTNFYQYACGQWIQNQELRGNDRERTILSEMEKENLRRLNDAAVGAVDRLRDVEWAYERKLERLVRTCLNQYQTTVYYEKNNPLISQIAAMGGWYVFSSSNYSSSWFKPHRETLGRDNFITVFFSYGIEPLDQQYHNFRISVGADTDFALPYNKWDIPGQNYEPAYKQMLINVAALMADDAGVKDAQLSTRITTFANDVVSVERALAKVVKNNEAELHSGTYVLKKLYSLPYLDYSFGWDDYFNATFTESPISISLYSTEVAVFTPKIIQGVADILRSSAISRQQINNYLVWRLIYSWLGDMSFEYSRELLTWQATLKGGNVEYKPAWISCMETAQRYMRQALDGVYVRRHFKHEDKDEINFMSESVRKSVASEIGKLDWMDDNTRKVASEKVSKVLEKMGVPDVMASELTAQNYLDYTYRLINMSRIDHYSNVKQLRQHARREIVVFYVYGRDPLSDWRSTPLYSIRSEYFPPWNEFIVPAGLLQFPIFSGTNPVMYRMMTYGSAGYRLARGYLEAIGERGQFFDKKGNELDKPWWSDATSKSYDSKKSCISNWYSKVETGPLQLDDKSTVRKKLTDPNAYAPRAILDLGALRNAYTSYKSAAVQSSQKTAGELFLPGASAKSKDEYFFLGFAQSHCAIRHDQVIYDRMSTTSEWLPEELMVNNLLTQMPEFSDVFQCPSGSPMNQGGCSAVF